MKRPITLALLITLLGVGGALAAQVSRVTLAYDNGATVATIQVQGQIRFTHQTEIPKDGKPHRVIVDVIGATYDLAAKQYSLLPPCLIKGIRGSQYSVTPEKVARIVFDLDRDPMYQVVSDAAGIHVSFPDKNQKPFAAWSTPAATPAATPAVSAKPTADAKPASPVATPPAVKPAESKPLVKVAATESDRQSSLVAKPTGSTAPAQPSASAAKSAQAPGSAPATSNTPAAPAFKSEIKSETKPSAGTTPMQQAAKPAVSPAPATTTPNTPVAKPAPAGTNPTVATTLQPKAATPETPSLTPSAKPAAPTVASPTPSVPAQTKPSPAVATPAPAKPAATSPASTFGPTLPAKPAEKSPVTATTPSPAPPKVTETTKPAAGASTSATPPATTPDAKTISTPDNKPADNNGNAPSPSAPTASGKPSSQSGILGPIAEAIKAQSQEAKPAEPTADKTPPAEGTPDEEEADNSDAASSTSRFRRSPAESFKIKGTMVAEFPQRLVIQYKPGKHRDPFATLIDESRTFDNPIADRVPNVEGLKLVGIIESAVGDNRGLFEDKNGYSYILKSGDKVQKGYVLRVERDRVYFQVFEYGWSRTVALTIE